MPPARLDPAELRRLIEEENLPQWKVAELLGVSRSCVERTGKRLNLKTAKTGPRPGDKHPGWKGGRVMQGGYRYLYRPDHPNATKAGYVLEHRLVVEQSLGRLLERNEVVHHIDANRENNDPANLVVFQTNAAHLRHELAGRLPEWTDEGKARIQEAVQQRANRYRWSKRDGSGRFQTSSRPPSKP
jgi:hypothetical protein